VRAEPAQKFNYEQTVGGIHGKTTRDVLVPGDDSTTRSEGTTTGELGRDTERWRTLSKRFLLMGGENAATGNRNCSTKKVTVLARKEKGIKNVEPITVGRGG